MSQGHVVASQEEGQTLAAVLRQIISGASWTEVRKHIHTRRVRVNGTLCVDDARRLRGGDLITLAGESARPIPTRIPILHQDDELLVIDKPAGIECERRPEQRDWPADRKQRHPAVAELLTPPIYPVHRIDRDTSGVLVYARTGDARQNLVRQFAQHSIERVYLAVAIGQMASATIHNWIIRDRGDGRRGCVAQSQPGAEEAITHCAAVRHLGPCTLLECRLETGRTHQIRLHLAEVGHPLCGEKLYCRPEIPDLSNAPRQALHAHAIALAHPRTGRPMRFASPMPSDLAAWMATLEAPRQ